ncbi:MAG TPA: 3-hydroxyacyl-CoA dehydrogenase NAD-binding domain-containing protein [Bryobacterales bacterium]|jgi:3-hydroxyacyl-CoA dehydrogenase|nr:3-hydroxyacyl-CoA dehydrogenase NAD-binding domain-containing protein [Bryobacterales bacterium]
MSRIIRKAAVLGAGTMGARIAAHLTNAGVETLLLDIAPDRLTDAEAAQGLTLESKTVRNRIVRQLFEAMQKSRPPALFLPALASRIRTGNFADDLPKIAGVDWIIEAIVENFDAKRALLAQVDNYRKPGTLVSSNTSGLPIASLAEGLSADFRAHWLGVHFFNPPRQMRLVEMIPTPETLPEVIDSLRDFCDRRLGKVVVFAKDRPNFIANRLFLFGLMDLLKSMQKHGLTIEEVDALTGPLIGRPNTATFRLADFVGVDVCVFVGENLYRLVPEDEQREVFSPPEFLKRMVEKRWIGDKAGQGFFKREGKERLVLNLETFEYGPPRPVDLPSLEAAKQIRDLGARLRFLLSQQDRAGRFLWDTWSRFLLYAAARIPEITDDVPSIDATMRYGFNWEKGPFEIWDAIGVPESTQRMEAEGKAMPPLVQKLLQSGGASFYKELQGDRFYFDLASVSYRPLSPRPGVTSLAALKQRNKILRSNPGASLIDTGNGILCLEFHSKANTLDRDVISMIRSGVEETESRYEGLVIGNEGQNFCAGANLQWLLELCRSQRWDEIDQAVRATQQAFLALRDCRKPVVAAVFGQTLGGGSELAMHTSRVQALAETYMGQVETAVGLIPAAGGAKELLWRWMGTIPADADPTPYLKEVFELIAMAKVSSSAAEAAEWRLLRSEDPVTMNRDRLIEDARQTALAMAQAGYAAPAAPAMIPVMGRAGLAYLKMSIYLARRAGYATEYDGHVATKLAYVLSGGDLAQPMSVPESYLLDLERQTFLSLCGEAKTQERVEYMLRTGKPLRN